MRFVITTRRGTGKPCNGRATAAGRGANEEGGERRGRRIGPTARRQPDRWEIHENLFLISWPIVVYICARYWPGPAWLSLIINFPRSNVVPFRRSAQPRDAEQQHRGILRASRKLILHAGSPRRRFAENEEVETFHESHLRFSVWRIGGRELDDRFMLESDHLFREVLGCPNRHTLEIQIARLRAKLCPDRVLPRPPVADDLPNDRYLRDSRENSQNLQKVRPRRPFSLLRRIRLSCFARRAFQMNRTHHSIGLT